MEIKQEPSPDVTGMSADQGISSKTVVMIKTMETAPQPSLQTKSQKRNCKPTHTLIVIIGLKWDPKFKMPPYDTFPQSFFRF